MTRSYPAEVERDADGRFVITFPDFGWGATDGATLEEALAEARDLLRELIATTIREGQALPAPSPACVRGTIAVPRAEVVPKAASVLTVLVLQGPRNERLRTVSDLGDGC